LRPIEEIGPLDAAAFDAEVRPAHRPVVIRGVARGWPLIEAALHSEHLPAHGRSMNGPSSPGRDQMIRRFLLKVVSSNG